MKHLNIATESIGFQTGIFFKELTQIITDLRASGEDLKTSFPKYSLRIDQCIFKHTGITSSCHVLSGGDNAFIILPALTRGHALNRNNFNKYLEKNFDADKLSFYALEKKGWIDPATSRVGGAFSEIIFNLYIGRMFLDSKNVSPQEGAAVILHEVGHAYTFLQFLADSVVTSHVLQRTYQELTNGNADGKVKIILTRAADDVNLKDREWLETISDNGDKEAAYKILVSAVAISDRGMDSKNAFSKDNSEELADVFAARHGAGVALLSMRAKYMVPEQSNDYLNALKFSVAGLLFAPLSFAAGLFFMIIGVSVLCVGLKESATIKDVATFKQEASKIRNQFVEKLKLVNLPKEEVKELLESLDLTDKLIQGYKGDFTPGLMMKFFDMFRRGKIEARASREYLSQLEDLSANNLFVRAAELNNH